jgi:hypothetical protein
MSNRRERRQLMRQLGISKSKGNSISEFNSSREDGQNIHRKHLQRVKNEIIRSDNERNLPTKEADDFFMYKNQTSEYSSFHTLLNKRDWTNFESNGDNAE